MSMQAITYLNVADLEASITDVQIANEVFDACIMLLSMVLISVLPRLLDYQPEWFSLHVI